MKRMLIMLCMLSVILGCAIGLSACNSSYSQDNDTVYTITYYANGGTFNGNLSVVEQKNVSDNIIYTAPEQPTRVGYSFIGWSATEIGSSLWKFETDKVTGDLNLYAVWKQKSAVIINVDEANIDDNLITMVVQKDTTFVSLASKVVCSDDSSWKLYYDRLGTTEIPTKIAAQISGELDDGDNLFYIVVNSQNGSSVNTYELIVHKICDVRVDYYNHKNVLIESKTVTTGNEFVASYIPTIPGYTFIGWKDDKGKSYDSGIIWHQLSLYADCTVNDYTLILNANYANGYDGAEVMVIYDKSFVLDVPHRVDYTFLGWYIDSVQLTDGEGKSINCWTFTNDKTAIAKWQANEYTVKLEVNYTGAGEVAGAGKYKYSENSSVNLSATVNLGYSWIGWYEGEELIAEEKVVTVEPADNVTYTAKWELADELANFDFVSTVNTLRVIGVKDKKVTEIIVPDYTTSIASGAFSGCGKLESITLPFIGDTPKTNNDEYQYPLGYIFGTTPYTGGSETMQSYNTVKNSIYSSGFAPEKTAFYIPSSLKRVNLTGGNILDYAFDNCVWLEDVIIPESATTIGMSAFHGCSSITSITIPNSVISLEYYAFAYCDRLTSVKLSVNLNSIGQQAFYRCKNLTSITIPNSVTVIRSSAFGWCTSLKSIIFENQNGWKKSDFVHYIGESDVSSDELANPATAATYLTVTYGEYDWVKKT